MICEIFLACFLSCVTIFSLRLVAWIRNYTEVRRELEKMPGPSEIPFIGALGMVTSNEPEHIFDNMRIGNKRFGGAYKFFVGMVPSVQISNPEDIEIIISTMKNSKKSFFYNLLHSWLGSGLLTSEGSKWHTRRKILTPSFHFSVLQQFISVFNEHAEKNGPSDEGGQEFERNKHFGLYSDVYPAQYL